jgi:hypothetical protein
MRTKALTVEPSWRKSSHSGPNGACVEIAQVAGPAAAVLAVRDSKDPAGPRLSFSTEAWRAFAGAAGAGEFGTA